MSVAYIKERFEDFCNWFTKTPEERQAIRIMREVRKARGDSPKNQPPDKIKRI